MACMLLRFVGALALAWHLPAVTTSTSLLPCPCEQTCQDARGPCLPRLGRRSRQQLTASLNRLWGAQAHEARVGCRHRRHRPSRPARRRLWNGWPSRGCRIGEASNPGPAAPGTPVGGERGAARRRDRSASPRAMVVDSPPAPHRLYCPVPGCPSADPSRAAGWTNKSTLRSHVDAHLAGTLQGQVPPQWFKGHNRQRCVVCGLSVSVRYGTHPTCQPAARAALGMGAAAGLLAPRRGYLFWTMCKGVGFAPFVMFLLLPASFGVRYWDGLWRRPCTIMTSRPGQSF